MTSKLISAFAVLCVLTAGARANDATAVVKRSVALHSKPSASSPSLDSLPPPITLDLIEDDPRAGYYHVRTQEGSEGWVWGKYISITAASGAVPSDTIDPSWDKPSPVVGTFTHNGRTCGPEGDESDKVTNHLKNRTDVPASYHDVSWLALHDLPYPYANKNREQWTADQTAAIKPYEGVPVRVEGYLVAVKPQAGSGESVNCGWTDEEETDWHVALVADPSQLEKDAVVVEPTPRIKIGHPGWSKARLTPWIKPKNSTAKDLPAVRISGWTMLDPSHRNHLGKYRATLWEIHPVTQIEVWKDDKWVALDALP